MVVERFHDLEDPERFSRQIMLKEIGVEGQRKLADASVLIVGLGGLGSPAATYLTSAGVGHIGLCDSDIIDSSNLPRQVLYEPSQVGMSKVEGAYCRLAKLSPHAIFTKHPEGLSFSNAEEIISHYDLVVDCTDNHATRFLIDDVCTRLGKKWIYGAIGEYDGQAAVFNGDGETHYPDLFPDRDHLSSLPRNKLGAFGPLPGIIGALEAAEAIKLIIGIKSPLDGAIFIFNILSLSSQLISLKPLNNETLE